MSFLPFSRPAKSMSRRLLRLVPAFALVLAACGDDPVAAIPDTISVAAASGTLTVAQGASGTMAVTLTRSINYSGAVALTAGGLPTGVTASFAPATLSGSTLTSTMTVDAAATASLGQVPITVRATGSGVTDGTAVITLTVNPKPAIALTITNPSPVVFPVVLPVGAQVSIALTRIGGYTGTVTMSAEGLPAGFSVSFAPTDITTGSGTVASVTVPIGAVRGTYPITFRATGTGVTAVTGTATITVN